MPMHTDARRKAGLARAASMTPEQRSEVGRKAANARWGGAGKPPHRDNSTVNPCLVYVMGTRGPQPQIWYEPMVDERGNARVKPEGMVLVGKPIPLPPRAKGQPAWTPEEADALVKRANAA